MYYLGQGYSLTSSNPSQTHLNQLLKILGLLEDYKKVHWNRAGTICGDQCYY